MFRIINPTLILVLCLTFGINAQESQPSNAAPEVISTSLPDSPIARAAKVSGTVNLDILVAEDGSVTSAKAIDGHPLLRIASEVSARKWQFAAAKSSSGLRWVRLIFTFRILPLNTPKANLKPIFVTPYQVEIRQTPPEGFSDPAPVLTPIRKKSAIGKSKCKSQRRNK